MFGQIDTLIEDNKYSKGSFVKAVENENCSKNKLKDWAIQKYFQTYHQNRVFSAIHANAIYEDVRQFEMEQLIAEETNINCGSDSHYNLIKRFAIAMGATEKEFETTNVGRPVREFVEYLINLCKNEHFVYGILSIYVNESQTSESATKLYTYLKKNFNLTDAELEWFLVHSEADEEHASKARTLIEKYSSEVRDFPTKSLEIVKNGIVMWKNLHEYYYSLIK